jgi:CheY-like chemotaxis protein
MKKLSDAKIMLIEDNQIDTFIAEKIFLNAEFRGEIIKCASVLAALNILDELLKQNESVPSIILLDLVLPLNDGFYFLEKFTHLFVEEKFKPEIVVLTAGINPDQKTQLLNNDCVTAYFNKPLTHDITTALLSSNYHLNSLNMLMSLKE